VVIFKPLFLKHAGYMITPKALRRKPIYMKPIYTNSL